MAATLEVLDEVGRGGTCVVHRGVLRGEHGTGRPVAVKRLLPERRVDPTSVDLFVQEAKLATRLNHPRILQAFELRKDEDGYLLLYEWIDGCTLDAIPGPWSAGQVATVGRAVCEALSYLHTLRDGAIVHRDVSPSNVFITRAGGVKLGDLGVAYCVDSAGPVPQAITRGFGAPEQLAQGRVDARADVYALGKTLLTLTDDSKLIGVLERATQDSPEARFESADALSSSLGEASETVSPQEIAALLDAPAPRPVLDHAVRSILGGSLEPASEAQATPVEAPEPVARADTRSNVRANVRGEGSARWLGLAPWIAAALLTSAGVWWSQQRRPSAQPN
ncbi:MAG: serine/threonine-protein kinase, partial [Myxococcota bacterium]